MLQTFTVVAILAVMLWGIAEVRGRRRVRVSLGLVSMIIVGWAAFQCGRDVERVHWAVETKHERSTIETCMYEIEKSLDAGDTETVLKAVSSYNQRLTSSTNTTRYLEASVTLLDHLK